MTLETRFRKFLKAKNLNNKQLSDLIGVSESTISKALQSGKLANSKIVILTVIAFDDLNSEWLLRGKGSMLIENIQVNEPKEDYGQSDLYNYNKLVEKVQEIERELKNIKKKEE